MKPKLVNVSSFVDNNMTDVLFNSVRGPHFDLSNYDESKSYDKSSTLFVANHYQYTMQSNLIDQLLDQGYKILFENICEANPILEHYLVHENVRSIVGATKTDYTSNIIQVPMYFWYRESKAWAGAIVDYKSHKRVDNFEKKFLLMMNRKKPFRTEVYNKFRPILDQGLVSYVGYKIRIPGDIDIDSMYWDRHINIDWFNTTQFSLVVETVQGGDDFLFITEKTMKPLAFKHPFMVLGSTHTLRQLKQSGFETFDNLFDEQYDTFLQPSEKLDWVFDQIINYDKLGYDNITNEKLLHNYHWFYNHDEIDRRYTQEIMNPLLEFVNTKT